MCVANSIWMDGTFRSAPTLFAQIYTLHIQLYDQFFPVAIALLPDKQEVTYTRLLQLLCAEAINRQLVFQPQVVHCDFEMAVFNSVANVLGINAIGSLFHFNQSIFRHIQTLGLQANYNNDNPLGVRRWLRRLMALPLVPPARLPGAYHAITVQAQQYPQAAAMHQYIEDTYMAPVGALFDIQCWNVYGTANRTTNMCEGFHSALNKAVAVRHPSVYRLIEVLQEVEATNERNIAQLALGAQPKRKKAKYVAVNEAISRLQANTFAAGGIPNIPQILNYVDAVAYQLWEVKH